MGGFGFLITRREADEFCQNIDRVLADSFKLTSSVDQLIESNFSPEQANFIKIPAKGKPAGKESLVDLMTAIKDRVSALKTANLILAIDPTREFIKKISRLVNEGREENADYMLVNIQRDPLLTAGLILEIDGRRIDRSRHV